MNEFFHLLDDGEKIIRILRPQKKTFMADFWVAMIIVNIPFWLLGIVFLIGLGDAYLLIPAVILDIFMLLIVYPILNAYYKSFLYGVTNKRVIIRTGIIGRDFRMIMLDSVTTIDYVVGFFDKICGENTVTLTFKNASNRESMFSEEKNKNKFLNIKNGVEVYKEIKELIKENKKNS